MVYSFRFENTGDEVRSPLPEEKSLEPAHDELFEKIFQSNIMGKEFRATRAPQDGGLSELIHDLASDTLHFPQKFYDNEKIDTPLSVEYNQISTDNKAFRRMVLSTLKRKSDPQV